MAVGAKNADALAPDGRQVNILPWCVSEMWECWNDDWKVMHTYCSEVTFFVSLGFCGCRCFLVFVDVHGSLIQLIYGANVMKA